MILKSSFSSLALFLALSYLNSVTGLQLEIRQLEPESTPGPTQLESNNLNAPISYFTPSDYEQLPCVFCHLLCTIMKVSLNLNINLIEVHVGTAWSLQVTVFLWVAFISQNGASSITEIPSMVPSLRMYVQAENNNLLDWDVDLQLRC